MHPRWCLQLINKVRHTNIVNTQHLVFWSNGYIFQPLIRVIRPYYNLRVEKITTANANRKILLYKRNHIIIIIIIIIILTSP
jgi:uncharacterized membrane protein YdbT with pleckstrin-like domain